MIEPMQERVEISSPTLGTIILAAGRSRRMGKPKLLLPWGKTSILGHLLAQWQRLGAKQVAVVCAEDDSAIRGELDRLGFPTGNRIFNPAPDRGMFSSLQCAAQWPNWVAELAIGGWHWAIQPHLSDETLANVLAFSANHPGKVCQPRHDGHRRHPVLLPKPAFQRLRESEAQNLRQFLDAMPEASSFCELTDPGLALDIDSPTDYETALKLWGPQ